MKAIISLAARMRSTRLPGKVMAEVAGKPILQHLVERLRHSQAEVVVSNNENDSELNELAFRLGVRYVPGGGCDMMQMHWIAGQVADADYILLAGADDPFLDPALFDMVLERLQKGDVAYVKTAGWPLGLNVWGWTRQAMEDGQRLATAPDERQHVVPFWERRPKTYPSAVLHRAGEDLYDRYRVTVDGPSDLELVRVVYSQRKWDWSHLADLPYDDPRRAPRAPGGGPTQDWIIQNLTAEMVIGFLESHPEVAAINADGLHGYAARDAIYSVQPIDDGVLEEVQKHVAIERAAALAADREEPREFHQGRAAALLSLSQWLEYRRVHWPFGAH